MFYIDLSLDNLNRFDFAKFSEEIDNARDILSSYLLSSLHKIPLGGIYKVINEASRPDLISYKLYGFTQYWWVILFYNNLVDSEDIVNGMELRYPLLRDLEVFYFELVSKSLLSQK